MMLVYFIGINILAYGAYKKRALTKAAAFVAILVASCILIGLSLYGLLLLATFFLTSTGIGLKKTRYSFQDDSQMVAKGNNRDLFQVVANGLWPAITAILFQLTGEILWLYSFVAVLAAATSDTWASEIGKHSMKQPIHIMTRRTIPTGQSGGVTRLGTLASIAGSFLLVTVAWVGQFFLDAPSFSLATATVLGFIGFTGQVVDTLVGATLQSLNYCVVCGEKTEKQIHCGKKTKVVKGYAFFTNDMVNHICSISAIVFTFLYGWLII